MKRKSFFVGFLILLIPSMLFAEFKLETGYDLYHNIQLMDNPQTPEDFSAVLYTTGYLAGYLDGYPRVLYI